MSLANYEMSEAKWNKMRALLERAKNVLQVDCGHCNEVARRCLTCGECPLYPKQCRLFGYNNLEDTLFSDISTAIYVLISKTDEMLSAIKASKSWFEQPMKGE